MTAQLSGFHPGITLAQFEKLSNVDDADKQLATLQAQINAAGNINAISAKAVPTVVAEPVFDQVHIPFHRDRTFWQRDQGFRSS